MNPPSALLTALKNFRLEGLDAGPDAIYPRYDGYSLVNLPASICHFLQKPSIGEQPLDTTYLEMLKGEYQHVIMIVVDGLGYNMLSNFIESDEWGWINPQDKAHLFSDALLFPLTSVVPSTTSTALTSLWTGMSPAAHGIVGYEVWLKEFGVVANMINHSPIFSNHDDGGLQRLGFSPETFLNIPTLGAHLSAHGIKTNAFQHSSIAHSGLSKMHMSHVNITTYRTLGDLWSTLNHFMNLKKTGQTYNYVYWGELDGLLHSYGPNDERIMGELSYFIANLARLIKKLESTHDGKTLILLTADHGAIETLPNPDFLMKNNPEISSCLSILPTGETRLPILFVKQGYEEKLFSYVERKWGNLFRLISAEEILQTGLLGKGKIHPNLRDRLGDWVVIPQKNAYWGWSVKEDRMLGRHGGLNEAEMLVPLVAWRV